MPDEKPTSEERQEMLDVIAGGSVDPYTEEGEEKEDKGKDDKKEEGDPPPEDDEGDTTGDDAGKDGEGDEGDEGENGEEGDDEEEEGEEDDKGEPSELDVLKARNAKLEEALANVVKGDEEPLTGAASEEPDVELPSREEAVSFFTSDMFSKVFDPETSPEEGASLLNKAFGEVYHKGLEEGFKRIPVLVHKVAGNVVAMERVIRRYYTNHPELAPYENAMMQEANRIAAKEPELTLTAMLEKAGEVVSKKLLLSKPSPDAKKEDAGDAKSTPKKQPKHHHKGTGTRRAPPPKLSDTAKAVQEVLGVAT